MGKVPVDQDQLPQLDPPIRAAGVDIVAARCQYLFTDGPDWRIKLRKLVLIDRDLPHYNLSFIL